MANDIGPPPTGIAWDEDYPSVDDAEGNGCYEIRDVRKGVRIRVEKEHVTPAGSSAGGEHKQGSAVFWIQEAEPTKRPDGSTALSAADIGRVWIDMTNHAIKILASTGPSVWTPFGELCLALYTAGNEPDRGLYMKGNELYFKGADGTEKPVGGLIDEDDMDSDSATQCPSQQSVKAYIDSGEVTMTNKTLTSPVVDTGISGTAVLDEDDMASDSNTKLATQQSIKAYNDNLPNVGGVVQVVSDQTGAYASGATQIPLDDTIPQISEGTEFMSVAITPTNASNTLVIEVIANLYCMNNYSITGAIFQDSTANALAAGIGHSDTYFYVQVCLRYSMTAGTTSETTFSFRAGASGANTVGFNGAASRALGGVCTSSITVTEIREE